MRLGPEETVKVFEQFKEDLWGPEVMQQAKKVSQALDHSYKLIANELNAHRDALAKGSRYAGGILSLRPVMTREQLKQIEADLNELAVLKRQIGILENGASDVSEVAAKHDAILQRLAPMTQRFRGAFQRPLDVGGGGAVIE